MIHRVARLFDKVQNDAEVAKWIRVFSRTDRNFAVIKISGASLFQYPNEICEDLAILSKLDLHVPVVYGWGNALTKKLELAGQKTLMHHTGVRVTRKSDLIFMEEVAHEHGMMIVEGLNERGIPAEIALDIFSAERKPLDGIDFEHFTGEIKNVNTDKLKEYLCKGIIPVIPPIGKNEAGQIFNINADTAAKAIVLDLIPQKYILLTNTRGVLDKSGELISQISISADYLNLVEQGIINEGMKLKIDEAKEIIEGMAHLEEDIAVQIANPENILSELFTDGGKGTFVKK
ncbi:MAG: hypothetical protein GXX85_08220 [Ignavibacteria bacterium]|nr:hypothetical protein [Ignavibacteria bacterium]